MKVLIVDSGGRAHALAKAYLKSKKVTEVLCVPGNDLMTLDKVRIFPQIKLTDKKKILDLVQKEKVDLVDVAQDDAIASGLVDDLTKLTVNVFGPTKKASQIEWDKSFARKFMEKFKLPIPKYKVFSSVPKAINWIKKQPEKEYFIKAAGLAAGKGAIYASNRKEAIRAVRSMKNFGRSGETFLIEEKLNGEEFSSFAIVSGNKFEILGHAQDHKTVFDENLGPNTGGMGCTSTPLVITINVEKQIRQIFSKTINGLNKIRRPYLGILYLGGIVDKGKVRIIEFNARWGEPEAEVVLPSIKNDYYKLVSDFLQRKIQKIVKDKKYRIVVAAAAKGYPGNSSRVVGKEIKGFSELLKNKSVTTLGTRVNISGKRFLSGGSRLFYVVAQGLSVDQARKVAYNALSKVSIGQGLLHYRRDIGYRDISRLTKKHADRESTYNN